MLHRTVTALVTSALLGAALLIAPAPSVAASASFKVIVQAPGDRVFVQAKGTLKIGTKLWSSALHRYVTVVEIERGVLFCEGYCDSEGFSIPEGTRGYIVSFSTDGAPYGMYLEDYWSGTRYSGLYNAIVVDGNPLGGEIFVQSASAFRIGGKYASTVLGSDVVMTITNIVPGRLDCHGWCDGFYLAEGSRGYILTYVAPGGDPYHWYTQDRLVSVCESSSRTRDRCRPTR
jgi:hypothetical protein